VGSHRLIDFLNPRKREIKEANPLHRILMIAAPIAAVLLLGYFVFSKLSGLDSEIEKIKLANAEMAEPVKQADRSIARTERVDQFLDGDVNWLDAMRLLASDMPSSDKLIVKSITGTTDQRRGGGTLTVIDGVTDPKVIDEFEESLRDENHQVVGDGSKYDEKAKDKYRWVYNEKITIPPDHVRQLRYEGLKPTTQPEAKTDAQSNLDDQANPDDQASPNDSAANNTAADNTTAVDTTEAQS
jgi:hypothetical protein